MSSEAPWGYLLPLRDGPPSLELTFDSATVGTCDKCTLQVDGALLGLPAGSAPQNLFTVRRDKSDGNVFLRCESDVVRLNAKNLQSGAVETLEHGARIALAAEEVTYVFVNREKSNSFTAPPDVLENYWVGHLLGSGGFGKVFVLFDKASNYRRKAMKVVEPKCEDHLRYAKREARILMTLKHPCVIETFNIERLGMQQFLVMEYMAGGDLRQFVNDNRLLTEEQTKIIFCQLALAVEYLHEEGICHRDLKPANILLQQRSPNTIIKVTDFGFAKDDSEDSSMKTFAGTKHYVAPEMINEDKYTNSVDVWSMGVILFYSLTGTLPFKSLDDAVNRRHVVIYDEGSWRGVTSQAQQLVKKMLKVKVADRLYVSQVIEDPWLSDETTRENIFRLTALEEYHPRSADLGGKELPWGYLLPLRDGVPPLELREDNVTVGNSDDCTLYVEATVLRLPAWTPPHVFFAVRRGTSTHKVQRRSKTVKVSINGKKLAPGAKRMALSHGALVAFDAKEATYVFVIREYSDSFESVPRDILGKYLIGHSLGGRPLAAYMMFEKKFNYERRAMKIVDSKYRHIFSTKEIKTLLSIKHPCVIKLFTIRSLEKNHFIVQEYMSGGDLSQFVNDQRLLSEDQVKLLFFQVVLAVEYLHKQNIFYCFLSPENILLQIRDPRTMIKVGDYGLITSHNNDFLHGISVEMGRYVAPEIVNFSIFNKESVDVWSMGMILYQSFTGFLPFKSLAHASYCSHSVTFYSSDWQRVSQVAEVLVKGMLQCDRKSRLTVRQVVEHPWLRDEAMREVAFELTGLSVMRESDGNTRCRGSCTLI